MIIPTEAEPAPAEPPVERPLSPLEVRSSLRVNMVAGCFGMVWAACAFGMPLPLFMEAAGASGLLIGLIGAVNQVAMVFQIPGALVVERMAWRKPFWASLTLTHRLLWFLPALLPFVLPGSREHYPWLMVAIIFASATLANAGSAAWQSWMADLVPARGGGQFWGLRQSWLTAASIVGVLGAGWLLDHVGGDAGSESALTGFSVVFALAALFGVADIVIHLWVREPRAAPVPASTPLKQRLAASMREKPFRRLTLAMGLWYFSVGLVGGFQFVYLKRDLDFTYTMMAQLSLLAAIGGTVSGFFFGTLMDRIGSKTLCLLLVATAPLCGAAWFFLSGGTLNLPLAGSVPQAMVVLGATMVVAGALYAGVLLCQVRLTALASHAEGRTMAMAVHWTLVGLAGALGPLAGGAVMDFIDRNPTGIMLPGGIEASFLHVLVLAHLLSALLLVLPALRGMNVSDRTLPVGAALGRVLVANPLQAVRNIYNISMLSAASTSRERALTVRSLGRSRAALAITDLIEQLDDPSLDVQEEAIASLGEIGDAEAIEALARLLGDHTSLLRAQAARALRQHAATVPMHALLDGLASDDRETVCECARTLGESGNAGSIPALRGVFLQSRDPKTRMCCAQALALLKDVEILEPLVDAWRMEPNPRHRLALACALGDCVGDRDGLYRLVERERKTPGEGVNTLLDRLARRQSPSAASTVPLDSPPARIAAALAASDFDRAWHIAAGMVDDMPPGGALNPPAHRLAQLLVRHGPPVQGRDAPPAALLLLLHVLAPGKPGNAARHA